MTVRDNNSWKNAHQWQKSKLLQASQAILEANFQKPREDKRDQRVQIPHFHLI